MDDKELLELAAKAAGVELYAKNIHTGRKGRTEWNPLLSDADALRLAVKLELAIVIDGEAFRVLIGRHDFTEAVEENAGSAEGMCAATRRAIVKAAAEIGKGLK